MLMGLSEEDYKTVLTMIQSKKMTSVLFSIIMFVISVSNTLFHCQLFLCSVRLLVSFQFKFCYFLFLM